MGIIAYLPRRANIRFMLLDGDIVNAELYYILKEGFTMW